MKLIYPSKYTMTLYDALNFQPDLLDFLDDEELFKNNNLKNRFISYYGYYEIGGETIQFFEIYIKSRYYELSPKYLRQLELWQNKLDYLKPITRTINKEYTDTDKGTDNRTIGNTENAVNSNNGTEIDYSLPNKNTTNEYPTSKNTYVNDNTNDITRNGTDNRSIDKTKNGNSNITDSKSYNIVEQTEKYSNAIRDVIQEFIYKFDDCFIQLM